MSAKDSKHILESELIMEMKPADARKYFERGFEILIEIASNGSLDTPARLDALRGVSQYYAIIAGKDSVDESMSKFANTQNRTLDEVKRLRRKPWEKDDESEDGEK